MLRVGATTKQSHLQPRRKEQDATCTDNHRTGLDALRRKEQDATSSDNHRTGLAGLRRKEQDATCRR